MTDRQRAFVAHYLATLNAADAARRAGYSARVADRQGYRLLRNAEIQAAVQAGKARQLAAADLSAQRVLEELRRLAFSNIAHCFDAAGNLLPIQALPAEVRSAVASVKVIKRNLTTGDGVVDTIHELKFWDKPRNLEMLAKALRADQGARRAPRVGGGPGHFEGARRAREDPWEGMTCDDTRPGGAAPRR